MKIAIITYQTAHQKTQDLVGGLLLNGYKNLTLLALPFSPRPERKVQFQHRFSYPYELNHKKLAINLDLKCFEFSAEEIESFLDENKFDFVLIAGAGLLPVGLALKHQIINAHPGFLPKVKGLDSLKWAILNETPEIGVSTHFISDKADEGILIDRKIVPIYKEDSFHSFAQRQYAIEIQMLVESIEKSKNLSPKIYLADENFKATMRMPIRLEEEMMRKFEIRRLNSPSRYLDTE
jgi:folate-dependent phosphoribosylglycinamide formyltransferase PurN